MRSRSLLLGVATALLGVGAALLVGACAAPMALRPARPGVGFGQPIGEADLAAWNIDIRTCDVPGLNPADAVMDAHSLPNVSMPNRDGFIPDDRPDTRAVRCMRDCK